jgi:hypothetical protein
MRQAEQFFSGQENAAATTGQSAVKQRMTGWLGCHPQSLITKVKPCHSGTAAPDLYRSSSPETVHVPQDEVNRRQTLASGPQALQPNISLDRGS